jgi:nucleoside-diphosphate-sugar epimerase
VPATLQNNLVSSVNLMTAAVEAGVGSVILAGSMEEPASSEPDPVPCSPYAAAKWAMAGYVRMFNALYGLDAVVLRVFMVYGPGQHDLRKLVPYVIVSCFRGESPKLSSGRRNVDWVHVDDVTNALVSAARRRDLGGETIDVGTGEVTSVRTVAEKVAALANPNVGLEIGALPDRPLERECVADVDRSEVLLGWKPAIPLDVGLAQTVDWYRDQWEKGAFRN